MKSQSSTPIQQKAMHLSIGVGILLLLLKLLAYWITNSAALFSDLAESCIHIFAIGFATYSLHLSLKPPDQNHLYGHDRIQFFSAGFEGALIAIASIAIFYTSVHKLIFGFTLSHIDSGFFITSIVVIITGALGWHLITVGKQTNSLIVESNGRHILTDCITSLGVLISLGAVYATGKVWIDPVIACITACGILRTGLRLLKKSITGLMDQVDPLFDLQLRDFLIVHTDEKGLDFHQLKHRNTGSQLLIEYHLLFPDDLYLHDAHDTATQIERELISRFGPNLTVTSHLEPSTSHHHE